MIWILGPSWKFQLRSRVGLKQQHAAGLQRARHLCANRERCKYCTHRISAKEAAGKLAQFEIGANEIDPIASGHDRVRVL